ncbi:class I SAM-dependent methyltransferase [Streptomyces longwoodensis]|uniref:class I SAM-dependent methyltransferase n=1 Tax=Streptomyces TaxID=1883 RepID=UPI002F917D65|nr:class I SAM-dependent methyltransferase [Streptomyces longwoodensis]
MPRAQAVPDQEPWWITNYRGRGPHQRYSHHNHAKTRRSVGFFIHHMGLQPSQAILDLCCAFGRHTHEFTRLGFPRTVGVDLSPDMLAHAASSAGANGRRPRFVRADVRALPFRNASADAVLMLRSFGFLDTPEEDLVVLKEAARVLRPGALLGMDHFPPNSATAKVGTRILKGPEATTTVHTTWDPATARLNSRMSTRYEDGHVEPFHSSSRLYTPEELRGAFAEAGFTVHGTFGGYDGSPLTGDSTRCIVVARRA